MLNSLQLEYSGKITPEQATKPSRPRNHTRTKKVVEKQPRLVCEKRIAADNEWNHRPGQRHITSKQGIACGKQLHYSIVFKRSRKEGAHYGCWD